jgi:nucleotide-binding universal stress UspA family protein
MFSKWCTLQYFKKSDTRHMLMTAAESIAVSSDQIKKRLNTLCKKELQDYPDSEDRVTAIEVREGFAAEEILTRAEKHACDVIIMGTHSKGIIGNTFLGSTAKRVLRRTRIPVFIIPLPKGEVDVDFQGI